MRTPPHPACHLPPPQPTNRWLTTAAERALVFDLVQACVDANVTKLGIHYWGMWKRIFPRGAPPNSHPNETQAELDLFEDKMTNVK